MNPEEQELAKLEQHLHGLSPAEPSEELTARIFSAFETPQDAAPAEVENVTPILKMTSNSWAQPFAAAAAVALIAGIVALVGLNRPTSKTAGTPEDDKEPITVRSSPVKFLPAHEQDTYRGSKVDGIIFTDDRRPLQTVRHEFLKTYTWETDDGSRVELQVPIERVRHVPVQTD